MVSFPWSLQFYGHHLSLSDTTDGCTKFRFGNFKRDEGRRDEGRRARGRGDEGMKGRKDEGTKGRGEWNSMKYDKVRMNHGEMNGGNGILQDGSLELIIWQSL